MIIPYNEHKVFAQLASRHANVANVGPILLRVRLLGSIIYIDTFHHESFHTVLGFPVVKKRLDIYHIIYWRLLLVYAVFP